MSNHLPAAELGVGRRRIPARRDATPSPVGALPGLSVSDFSGLCPVARECDFPEMPAKATPLRAARPGCPQGLRLEIALIIRELARAAVRREDRRALKADAAAEEEDISK
jgi:hypothetical protein